MMEQHNTVVTVSKGFGSIHSTSTQPKESSNSMTVEEVRRILNESLQGNDLFDYIRVERTER